MGGDLRYDPAAIGDYPGGGCIRKLHDADSAGAHHAKDAGMGARAPIPPIRPEMKSIDTVAGGGPDSVGSRVPPLFTSAWRSVSRSGSD
jgi:hypothetical protein